MCAFFSGVEYEDYGCLMKTRKTNTDNCNKKHVLDLKMIKVQLKISKFKIGVAGGERKRERGGNFYLKFSNPNMLNFWMFQTHRFVFRSKLQMTFKSQYFFSSLLCSRSVPSFFFSLSLSLSLSLSFLS